MGSDNIKKFELKLGGTGLVIVIAGMAVLLCSAFILGVGFGRNIDTYPEKISSIPQRILAMFWRPAKVESQQKIAESSDVAPEKGSMDLAFHNALVDQKTPSMQQAPVATKKPDNEAIVVDQSVSSQVPSEVEPVKEVASETKAAVSEKPAEEKKSVARETSPSSKEVKETPAASSKGTSSILIHVVSMKDRDKANQIAKTVASMGYPAKVSRADIKGKGVFYRVITTGFKTNEQAQAAADKISKKVNTKCIILPAGKDMDKNQ
jgi:cell division septation protein DedD